MTAYADLHELEDRLEWDLTDEEKRVAQSALDDLSVDAAHHGREWTRANVPALVKRVVLAATTRYLRNLEGVVQSRAGDETLVYGEDKLAGSAHFTTDEVKAIIAVAMGYNAGIGSIQMTVDKPKPRSARRVIDGMGRVPVDYGNPGRTFPFYGDGELG